MNYLWSLYYTNINSYGTTLLLVAALLTVSDYQGGVIGIGLAAIYYFLADWRHLIMSEKYRKRVTITASAKGLARDDHLFAIKDIADLQIREGGKPPARATIVASGGGNVFVGAGFSGVATASIVTAAGNVGSAIGTAANNLVASIRNAARQQQIDCSYILTIRTKQSSESEVLAGGLTLDCAKSLMNDLIEALQKLHG